MKMVLSNSGSYKFSDKFISTKEIQGTKKFLDNERRIELSPGDLLLFNPLIHRGNCIGRKKDKELISIWDFLGPNILNMWQVQTR